jgi:hypothetical protein
MVKLLKKHGFAPSRVVTDRLRAYPAAFRAIGLTAEHDRGLRANNRAERISRYDAENENCSGSNHPAQSNVSSPSMPPHSTHLPINVICCADRVSRSFAPVHSALGPRHPPPHDACRPLHSPQLNADNVTKPPNTLFPRDIRTGREKFLCNFCGGSMACDHRHSAPRVLMPTAALVSYS